ncbi:MAG TPA: hypothetical protein VH088_16555 [Terriglobales bacterium]|nr:hypothetical protein [Terriglobales bacterium]
MDERQRLTDLYSQKTDEELQEIAAEGYSLSDVGRETLTAELARRNLPPMKVSEETTQIEYQDLVTIRQFRDVPEAILAKGLLDSAEIDSFLGDENIVRMDWFISNLVGGIKLKVRREDVEAANLVLQEPAPGELTEEDDDL